MKVGDIVMFSNENSTYAKYFYGAIGTIDSTSTVHCTVAWLPPGPLYFGKRVPASSFAMADFSVLVEGPYTP